MKKRIAAAIGLVMFVGGALAADKTTEVDGEKLRRAQERLEQRQRERQTTAATQPAATSRPVRPVLKSTASEAAKRYYKASIRQQIQYEVDLGSRISNTKEQLRIVRGSKLEDKASRARQITDVLRDLEKERRDIDRNKDRIFEPELTRFPLEVGDAGRLAFEVDQVVSDGDFIVSAGDDADRVTIWLTGFKTDGWTDGRRASAVVEIAGTKRYDTAIGGARTVLLARPFDINEHLDR